MTIDLSEKRRRRKNERNAAMYDQDVFDLLQAIDTWRRKNDRSFPAWSEVLQILKSLGWRKTAAPDPKPDAMPAAAPALTTLLAPVEPTDDEPVEPVHASKAVEPMATAKALPAPRSKRS
jgi:hypothetical protein